MKNKLSGLLAAAAFTPFAQAADPAVYAITCPATIATNQALRTPAPAGWLQVGDPVDESAKEWHNMHRFVGVSVFTNHPSERYELVPDNPNDFGRGRRFVQRWTFSDTAGVYLSCIYNNTTVQLTRPVPSGYKRCEVRYEKKRTTEIVGISCSK